MAVKITTVETYENFGKCVRITNGQIEALVTVDVGPRVIQCNRIGGANIMFTDIHREHFNNGPHYDAFYYKGAQWNIYGGHRLWIAPESSPETAYPDNNPITYEVHENSVVFIQPPQVQNNISLEMEFIMDPEKPEIQIIHKVKNIGKTDKTFAVWALSVLAPGGVEIIPQNTQDTGLLPNRCISMWPYCDFSDPRLSLGHRYVTLTQNPQYGPFKMGFDNNSGTAHYVTEDTVFTKQYFPNHPDGVYADYGCSFETYTNELFLEMETLGELKTVAPGETEIHKECWKLSAKKAAFTAEDDHSIDAFLTSIQ